MEQKKLHKAEKERQQKLLQKQQQKQQKQQQQQPKKQQMQVQKQKHRQQQGNYQAGLHHQQRHLPMQPPTSTQRNGSHQGFQLPDITRPPPTKGLFQQQQQQHQQQQQQSQIGPKQLQLLLRLADILAQSGFLLGMPEH